MKRIVAAILSAALLLSLAACGVAKDAPEAYVPSADIEVAIAFVDNGTAKVVTRRTSDKELNSIDLCCVYFDSDGTQKGEAETIQCDFETKGELSIWTFTAATNSAYVEAAVSSVTYADETKQSCPGVSTWADETVRSFSVDAYNKKMKQMANKEAGAAEKCDAAEISLGTPAEGKIQLGVKNISGKEVAEVVAYLLWFDANGAPIDMKGVLVPNAEKVSAKTLAVDEEASYTATAPEGAATAKAIVQSVTFGDGTVWGNNYVYEWAVANYEAAE